MFVRRKQGIEKLNELLRAAEKNYIPFQQAAEHLYKVQALLSEIDGTKKQIETLNDEIGFFFADNDKLRARDSLKARLEALLKQLDELCARHTSQSRKQSENVL